MEERLVIYIDPQNGDDNEAGTRHHPVATWARALDIIEGHVQHEEYAGAQIEVMAPLPSDNTRAAERARLKEFQEIIDSGGLLKLGELEELLTIAHALAWDLANVVKRVERCVDVP